MSTAFSPAPRSRAIGAAQVEPADHRPERDSELRAPVAVAGVACHTDRDTSHINERAQSGAVANRALDILRRRARNAGQGPDGDANAPRPAPSTVIRRIIGKDKDAIGRKVSSTENSKWGTGTILQFQGPKYEVEFAKKVRRWVPAAALKFADGDDGALDQPDRKPAAPVLPIKEIDVSDSDSSDSESDDARYIGTNTTPLASKKPSQRPTKPYGDNPKAGGRAEHDDRPHRGDTSNGPAAKVDNTEGIIPTKLTVSKLVTSSEGVKSKKKKNKTLWILALTDGSKVLSETTVGQHEIKTVLENLVGPGARPELTNTDPPKGNANSPIEEGTYALNPGLEKYGALDDGLRTTRTKRRNEIEQLKALALLGDRRLVTSAAGKNLTQEQIQAHLKSLPKPLIAEAGHKSVKMLKIELNTKQITLTVAGKPRAITHLYTQKGNGGNEVRCYLGNAEGAYQRVHTSLTEKFDAHTMVQTGPEVSVPGWERQTKEKKTIVGTRVGFDSSEGVGPLITPPGGQSYHTPVEPGFAARDLSIRSLSQTNVGPTLIAHPKKLQPDELAACLDLARVFNVVLDQVFAGLTGPDGAGGVTGITGDFKVLDESWLFDDGLQATPFKELEHIRQKNRDQ